MRRSEVPVPADIEIPFEWNMYDEGFKMFAINHKTLRKMEKVRINRINDLIWRMNKEMDKVLVQKVNLIQKVEDYTKFEPKTTSLMRIIKNLAIVFCICFYISTMFLKDSHDETNEIVIYVFFGIVI